MRIGMKMTWALGLASHQRMAKNLYKALAGHELIFLPGDYVYYLSEEERQRTAERFLQSVDVVAGVPDASLATARQRLGSSVPFVFFVHGGLPMGAWTQRQYLPYLTTRDVLMVSGTADQALMSQYFTNANAPIVPFAYDPAFSPMDEEERREVRRKLGFGENDRIILYAGRINPVKHVHTLLRVFGVISKRIPDARLVLAGAVESGSLGPYGVFPVEYFGSFSRFISKLDMPERVHMIGATRTEQLRELYNIADLKVNLTLNPDENFGLAQVECMACGTPVVGTAWGGLKDSIVDGVTGYQVSTVATPTGVKLSWWEAINRVVALLEDGPARARMRSACLRHAERYTLAAHIDTLGEVLASVERDAGRPAEPLQATPWAQDFWLVCDRKEPVGMFRRGPRSKELSRELAAPYTGALPENVPPGEPLEAGQVLSLATPVEMSPAGWMRLDDPLHPLRLDVPPAYLENVRAIFTAMREEPAITVDKLTRVRLATLADVSAALQWMLETGLVLRTRPIPGWIEPETVDRRMSEVLFSVQYVDRQATDLVVYE